MYTPPSNDDSILQKGADLPNQFKPVQVMPQKELALRQ